ncbi:MAG: hypothetical protein PHI86_08035 [Candidatus Omnitrophica bacterium]|nr:hypothetical protein [Candidatus Omnitrophota bacterium]
MPLPIPKAPQKPPEKPAPKPGIFGQRSSYEDWQLREYLRKAPPNIPESSRTFTENERAGLEGVLKKYGAGSSGIYTPDNFRNALNRMRQEKENMICKIQADYDKKEALKRQIKYFEKLEKGN